MGGLYVIMQILTEDGKQDADDPAKEAAGDVALTEPSTVAELHGAAQELQRPLTAHDLHMTSHDLSTRPQITAAKDPKQPLAQCRLIGEWV